MLTREIVLLIDSLRPYGAERVALELATSLSDHVAVRVITFKGSESENAARLTPGVSHTHLVLRFRKLARLAELVLRVTLLLMRLRPGVVVLSFMPYANAVAAVAGTLSRVPVIATEHTLMSVARYGGRERPLLRVAMHLYLKQVDAIVAVSHAVARDLTGRFGARGNRISVIYNPVSIDRLLASAGAGLGTVAPRTSNETRIVMVANLKHQKGHRIAFRALTHLPKDHALYVIGDGPEAADLQRAAHLCAVSDRVHFVGWQEHPAAWLASADVVWVPSVVEGFGLTLVEAWALGIPVVPSAASGLAEVAMLLGLKTVPVGDPEALATATLARSAYAPPAEESRRIVLKHLAPNAVALEYLSVVNEVAA